MNIVKNYRTEIAPGEYSDDGCFTRELTEATIMIEDEETYSVKAWKITNTLTPPSSITSITSTTTKIITNITKQTKTIH